MDAKALGQFIPLILIFVIFYFLLIRPQQKRIKEHKAMVNALQRGDQVVTAGGLLGKIERILDNEKVEVQISENVEVLNNFETRKAEIIIKDDEDDQELKMNIWFTEKTLKAPIIELTRKKLKNIFNGSIPPSLGFNEMNIPFEDYDINKDAVNVKFETINKNGTFTYNLLEYSSKDSLPDIFKIPKNYKKVKKL